MKPKTVRGPGLFISQFIDAEPPFDSLGDLAAWASDLGFKALQIPVSDPRLKDLAGLSEKDAVTRIEALVSKTGLAISEIAAQCRYRRLCVRDLNLRCFGPYDRKSRRAQLSIRHGDRNYDRSIAGLGTRKAQCYFAYDFDRLSSRSFDANGIAAVSRRWRLAPRYCTRSASTALQYRIEKNLTKANYMKVARTLSTS
jgi:hypothetical protein